MKNFFWWVINTS